MEKCHYSAIFFPATPDWGYQNCRTCVLCLEHRVPAGCAWRTCPRGDCSTRVPIDLACGLLFAVCGFWLCCLCACHPSRDGPTHREIHRPTSLAREHLREQLGFGHRERSLSSGQRGSNPPGPDSRLPPIRRRHLCLRPLAREGHSPGRQPSFLYHRGARLGSTNCLPDLALCPGCLAAGRAQAHPRLYRQHGCSRLGHANPPDYPGHRGAGRGPTRQHLGSPPRRRASCSLFCRPSWTCWSCP